MSNADFSAMSQRKRRGLRSDVLASMHRLA